MRLPALSAPNVCRNADHGHPLIGGTAWILSFYPPRICESDIL